VGNTGKNGSQKVAKTVRNPSTYALVDVHYPP